MQRLLETGMNVSVTFSMLRWAALPAPAIDSPLPEQRRVEVSLSAIPAISHPLFRRVGDIVALIRYNGVISALGVVPSMGQQRWTLVMAVLDGIYA